MSAQEAVFTALWPFHPEPGEELLSRLLPTLLAVLVSGCASYAPHPTAPPPPVGTEVRVNLTTPGAVRVSDIVGRPIRQVEGRLTDWSQDSLSVALLSAEEWGRPWEGVDTLALARSELALLEEKTIDRGRTFLLIGGGSALLGVTIVSLFKAAGGDDDGGRDGPPDQILVPLLSWVH